MLTTPGAAGPWRRRAVVGVAGLWALVGLARLTRLVEPPEPRPGRQVESMLSFLRATIPPEAGYLYVLPLAFGSVGDSGAAPRLRYELYPRVYDDVRASADEDTVRQLMLARGLSFVVVPDASLYVAESWLRQPPAWLLRIDFSSDQYVLQVVA